MIPDRLRRRLLNEDSRLLADAEHVQVLYRTFLGRTPAPAEVSAWLTILANQLADVENRFVASPEFQARLARLR